MVLTVGLADGQGSTPLRQGHKSGRMTTATLSRRPHNNPHQVGWDVYFGDARIGHIGERAGVPMDVDQWGWTLGFHPGAAVDAHKRGTAGSFEAARSAFEQAWKELEPTLTDENYEAWRDDRDATAWKYRMWDEHCRMPAQTRDGRSRCFCGAEITSASVSDHVRTTHRGIGT